MGAPQQLDGLYGKIPSMDDLGVPPWIGNLRMYKQDTESPASTALTANRCALNFAAHGHSGGIASRWCLSRGPLVIACILGTPSTKPCATNAATHFHNIIILISFLSLRLQAKLRKEMERNGKKQKDMERNGKKWKEMERNGKRWKEMERNGKKWKE